MLKKQKGFTLIELLIVIAIIAIIAAVVFVALDPLKRFQDARNSTRWSDVTNILAAIKLNQVDNGGNYLAAVTALANGTVAVIGTGPLGTYTCTAQPATQTVDLTGLTTSGYLGAVPKDPSGGTDVITRYYLIKNANGTITIGACSPEGTGTVINAVR